MLHPTIAEKCWSAFIRGEYDTAIFQAFKEVEVSVRDKAGFDGSKRGVPLMRDTFRVETGPLTETAQLTAERQALSDLFAGAIGSYKNPQSHHHVGIDVREASELLVLASHLLEIVESRGD